MKVADIAKSAAVRYLVYAVLALLLGYFGIGHAQARTATLPIPCTDPLTTACVDKAAALAEAQKQANLTSHVVSRGDTDAAGYALWIATLMSTSEYPASGTVPAYIRAAIDDVAPNGFHKVHTTLNFYYKPKDCSAASNPPLGETWMSYATGSPQNPEENRPSMACKDGCTYACSFPDCSGDSVEVDGTRYADFTGAAAWGSTCAAGDGSAAPGSAPPQDTDGDGHSDGNDSSPNNPGVGGNGSGQDESGKGPGTGPGGGQGNGAGEGSGNGNTSGGGGNCGVPPSSSGDAILGQIAYQAWATRCAIEGAKDGNGNLKTTGSGTGTGTGTGTGSGNGTCAEGAVNAAICATKDYAKKLSDFVDGITNNSGDLDTDQGETEEPDKVWIESPTEADLNSSGFGWGSSCPAPPEFMGYSLDAAGNLCMFASLIGAFMLLGAYAQAAYIIGRA